MKFFSFLALLIPCSFTPSNITANFQTTGNCPFNDDILVNDNFLSSGVTNQPIAEPASESRDEDTTSSNPEKEGGVASQYTQVTCTSIQIVSSIIIRPCPKASPQKAT